MLKVRNGKIELFRFIFCVLIIFHHLDTVLFGKDNEVKFFNQFDFFKEGRIGVEFFFIVSGFLMAKTAFKIVSSGNKNSLSKNTFQFMYRKYIGIFPYQVFTFIIAVSLYFKFNEGEVIERIESFISFLPQLFFLQKTGIHTEKLLSVHWYISAMLIVMFILFPILLKHYKNFSRIIAPILAVMIIGGMNLLFPLASGYLTTSFLFLFCGLLAICALEFLLLRL